MNELDAAINLHTDAGVGEICRRTGTRLKLLSTGAVKVDVWVCMEHSWDTGSVFFIAGSKWAAFKAARDRVIAHNERVQCSRRNQYTPREIRLLKSAIHGLSGIYWNSDFVQISVNKWEVEL